MEIFQRTLSLSAQRPFLSESGCKGTAFSDTIQIFRQLFSKNDESFRDYLQKTLPTPYYII
jgi:hypothetical protein